MTDQQPAPEPEGFVGTSAARVRLARLKARKGAPERVDRIRAEMADADREYAENLASIRKAADLTQVELAKLMGVAQSEISRIESRPDMLLSTLANYLTAAGATRSRVVVTIGGQEVEIDLTAIVG
ncbi:ribosome-binding protein aMBF1 (putative translation factor) [Catenuloplanes nepalensis]|uniref:Ribosome-binding protein aMBF1 (Putative translation factor) n=1 Tax=Catenuloplanes nepalensis TaxID=587533 RepID=A0ABT9N5G0_9ACTN|nr:helix-turn-helix transcriptional regulator [Catenuloplanes nepalensis]MDP9798942.1 ribosome-binding protein aMBF1 (putative translation factor) [Catenuloplanes nepalensis]